MGLATYAFQSNIQRANLLAVSTFSVVLCVNWTLCRAKRVEDKVAVGNYEEKLKAYIKNRHKNDVKVDSDS